MPKENCMFCGKEISYTDEEYKEYTDVCHKSAFVIICDDCTKASQLKMRAEQDQFEKDQEAWQIEKAKMLASGKVVE